MGKKYEGIPLETRAYPIEVRAEDSAEERGVISGLAVVYGSDAEITDFWGDTYTERIAPGALDATDLRDVRLYVNHDGKGLSLARSKNGRGTLDLSVTERGLEFRARLDVENSPDAQSLYSAIQRGDMDGMSFAFRVGGDEWEGLDSDTPIRTIKSISVIYEISAVNRPAYTATSVTARSSAEETVSPLAEARRAHREETLSLERAKVHNRAKR